MMAKPEGGRFDEDTYARARAWVEKQKAAAPKPAKLSDDEKRANATDDPIAEMNRQKGWTSTGNPKAESAKARVKATKPAAKAASTTDADLDAYASTKKGDAGRGKAAGATAADYKGERIREGFVKAGLLPRRNDNTTAREAAGKALDIAAAIPALRGVKAAKAIGSASRAVGAPALTPVTRIPNRVAPAAQKAIEGSKSAKALPAPARGTALPAPAKQPALGGPKAGQRALPMDKLSQRASPAQRRSEEGFSPQEALAALKRNGATKAKPATKAKAPARKPSVSVAPARSPKSATTSRKRTRYSQDESGTEFRKGGVTRAKGCK